MTENRSDAQSGQSAGATLAGILGAAAVHLCLATIVFFYFYLYVPHQKEVFADFGVALPDAVFVVIRISDLLVSYWHLVLPALILAIPGFDALIMTVTRSRAGRLGLIAVPAILSIGLLLSCHMILKMPMDQLVEQLQ